MSLLLLQKKRRVTFADALEKGQGLGLVERRAVEFTNTRPALKLIGAILLGFAVVTALVLWAPADAYRIVFGGVFLSSVFGAAFITVLLTRFVVRRVQAAKSVAECVADTDASPEQCAHLVSLG